jgi:hypothetical protein
VCRITAISIFHHQKLKYGIYVIPIEFDIYQNMTSVVSVKPTRNDFKFGILCASTTEYMAVYCMLLDMLNDDYAVQRGQGDKNDYKFGKIKDTYFVLASSVDENPCVLTSSFCSMQGSFPKLETICLVSAAAGMPVEGSKLGDVVVAKQVFNYSYADNDTRFCYKLPSKYMDAFSALNYIHLKSGTLEELVNKHLAVLAPSIKHTYCDKPDEKVGAASVHLAPVGSCPTMRYDADALRKINKEFGFASMDMVSYGLTGASDHCRNYVAIHGLSHFGSVEQEKAWMCHSSALAAAYLRVILDKL